MFESLSEKLGAVFKRLEGKGRITEADMDAALREVRLALLEADVNFKVVKDFIAQIRERCLGAEVMESLTPGQQVIKVVCDELTAILGGAEKKLDRKEKPPTVIMLTGIQGSGKTTTAAKLALHFKKSRQSSLMVAADLQRPAAVDQLVILGKQLDLPVHSEGTSSQPTVVCANALKKAKELGTEWVIVDTAGRLHIDEGLMEELTKLKSVLEPTESLMVVDAMTGQDAVTSAQEFHSRIGLTGLILAKMDGDARGGAALSITSVTGVPVKFIGTGEKVDGLEVFHPDRLASRILGMGDVLSLVEKAEATFNEARTKELESKMLSATFDLEDFLEQLQQVKSMGPLSQVMEMIPGFSALSRRMSGLNVEDNQLKKIEAIIYSMTPEERHKPSIVGGSRRKRIARGSGVRPQDINQLLNQFRQMQKFMKQVALGKGRLSEKGLSKLFR